MNTIQKVQWSSIPNTISGVAKGRIRDNRSIFDPAKLCFAVGEGSFAEDGREDLQLSSQLASNILCAFKTDFRSDDDTSSYIEVERKRKPGNPIIWGALSKAKISILGTDEEPVFVVLSDGRQTAKHCLWLTDFLRRCRAALKEHKDAKKAQGALMISDPIAAKFSERVWYEVFTHSPRLGRPLVSMNHSAQVHLECGFTDDDPGNVQSLERASMANFRIPSHFSGEATKLRRFIEHDAWQAAKNGHAKVLPEFFFAQRKQFVQNPVAVGGATEPSDAYIEALYKFAFVHPEIQAAVDAITDPVKGLQAMMRAADKYFRASEVEVERDGVKYFITQNKLTPEQQIALRDKPKAERKPRAPKPSAGAKDRVSIYRSEAATLHSFTTCVSEKHLTEAEQRDVDAAAAWLKYQAGDKDALRDFPGLRKVAGIEDNSVLTAAREMVEGWDGKSAFTYTDADDQKAVRELLTEMQTAMPEIKKPTDRVVWAIEWLADKKESK